MTRGSPAPTPYPHPQTPYPSRVRVCITRRWTRVVAIPVSPRGYAVVVHSRDRTNIPCVSRDTPVLAGAVTNAVTRARWPSSTRRRGHRRSRSPSWVLLLLLRVVRRPSSVVVVRRCRRPSCVVAIVRLPSSSSVVLVVGSSSPSPSSSERNSQLAVSGDDDVLVRRPCRASSCRPRRGAGWLLLCGRAARQCGWAVEEAATHLCRVVGAPPTRLEPSPASSICRRRRRRRHRKWRRPSSSVVADRADAHVRVVSLGSGLDAAMHAPVLDGGHTTNPLAVAIVVVRAVIVETSSLRLISMCKNIVSRG